ncbi:HGxxPAAW family protein [Streptomyces sp. NPDC050121]|uniref:HGxxPAAW family protein n=1 Tax=Streptomyces sp. NPDC050121 TaxID=3365601 RepID=UPI0037B9DACD
MSGHQDEGHRYDEGHTVAGWTGVGIATVGTAVAGVGVCAVSAVLIAGGLAVVGVSALVTWGLHLTGWGKPPGVRPRAEWGMRVRDPGARGGHPGCVGCRLAGRAPMGEGALSVPGPTVAGDGTGMEVRGAAVAGGGARADVGRGAS